MPNTDKLVALSNQFFADPLSRQFDFDAEQLKPAAFVSKWVPRLNSYAIAKLSDKDLLREWVWLVFAEHEINLTDFQH